MRELPQKRTPYIESSGVGISQWSQVRGGQGSGMHASHMQGAEFLSLAWKVLQSLIGDSGVMAPAAGLSKVPSTEPKH